jgi:HipA-like protein
LPEGWLLRFISTALHIDTSEKFELLLRLGHDPIGAVSVRSAQ